MRTLIGELLEGHNAFRRVPTTSPRTNAWQQQAVSSSDDPGLHPRNHPPASLKRVTTYPKRNPSPVRSAVPTAGGGAPRRARQAAQWECPGCTESKIMSTVRNWL